MNNRVQQDHEKYEQCKSESEICWQAAKVQNAPGESHINRVTCYMLVTGSPLIHDLMLA